MSAASLPITFHALGSAEAKPPLTDLEKTITSLQADELLVKVAYASINPMDPKIQLHNFMRLPLPLIVGFDFSGTVVALGGPLPSDWDQAVEVGSKVFGLAGTGGAYAEYVVVKRDWVVLTGDVGEPEASTYAIAYASAHGGVEEVGEASKRAGQWLYVAGGGGGVGHFAVQLGKVAGMKVIASASKPDALRFLHSLGVDHVIDYSKQHVVKEVLALTGGKGAELVYDPTYSVSSYKQSASVVSSGGLWLKLGSQDDAEARSIAESRGAKVVQADWGSMRYAFNPEARKQTVKLRQMFEQAKRWYTEGKVKPHVTEVVPFEAKALQKAFVDRLNQKSGIGKSVVHIAK